MLYSKKEGNTNKNNIILGHGVFSVQEGLDVIARYDKVFEANEKGDDISYIPFASNSPSNFVLAGISYSVKKQVKIMPNIEYVFYDSTRVYSDLYPRLTLYFKI